MNRHIFIALAVVFGAVQGLPQHRFQPYKVSFTAGKLTDEVSKGDVVAPIVPPSGSESLSNAETSENTVEPYVNQETSPLDSGLTTKMQKFQNLWNSAAVNLINIPFLLEWVSSLQPESWSKPEQPVEPLPEPLAQVQEPEEASVFVEAPEQIIAESEVITEVYADTEITTEAIPVEELLQEPMQTPEEATTVQPEVPAVQEQAKSEPSPIEPLDPLPQTPEDQIALTHFEAKPEDTFEAPIEEIQPTKDITESKPAAEEEKTQHSEKIPLVENKLAINKFKVNKFDTSKQPLKKGKTLFSFAPEPQQASAFPSYSYSVRHQPSTRFTGR